MSSFGPTGIIVDRQTDVFDALIADLQALWGDNIKTTGDSIIGSLMTIWSEAIANQNELVEATVAAFQPSKAIGVFLSELVRFNGIDRNEAEFSTVSVTITANAGGTTVLEDSVISDPDDSAVKFVIDNDTVLAPFASALVSATAQESGPVVAAATTLTKIDTPLFGWASVSNPSDAIVGQNEETDTALRARRDSASKQKSSAGVAAIFTAVGDIQDVVDVVVHENTGASVDSFGVPPGAFWVIVEGGDDADIAQAISEHRGAGTGTFGTVSFPHPNIAAPGGIETINFSRPVLRDVYLSLTLDKGSTYPGDGDELINAALVTYFGANQTLGKKVSQSQLYSPINTAVPDQSVDDLFLDFTASPTNEDDLILAINEKAVTATLKIVIT